MKTRIICASAAIIYSSYTLAELPSTVTFQGEIYPHTCNVNVNGNSTAPIVLLPTVNIDKLSTAQAVAGQTKFTINVTDCNSDYSVIKTVFAGNNITINGNLGSTGTAENVSIQLLNSDGINILQFINGESVESSPFIKENNSSSASQELFAQYYAESTVTAGTVIASAQFAISYD